MIRIYFFNGILIRVSWWNHDFDDNDTYYSSAFLRNCLPVIVNGTYQIVEQGRNLQMRVYCCSSQV